MTTFQGTVLCIALLLLPPALATASDAEVISIVDGDTILINDGTKKIIRLAYIDAPELQQGNGQRSKRNLKKIIISNKINYTPKYTDVYGRINAVVLHRNINVNLKQVSDGYAWTTARFNKNEYLLAEENAKKYQLGIWLEPPTAPWIFREKLLSQAQKND